MHVFPDQAAFNRPSDAMARHSGSISAFPIRLLRAQPADKRHADLFANPTGIRKARALLAQDVAPELFAILFDAIAAARGKNCSPFPRSSANGCRASRLLTPAAMS